MHARTQRSLPAGRGEQGDGEQRDSRCAAQRGG